MVHCVSHIIELLVQLSGHVLPARRVLEPVHVSPELIHVPARRVSELVRVPARRVLELSHVHAELIHVSARRVLELAHVSARRVLELAHVSARRVSELAHVSARRVFDRARVSFCEFGQKLSHGHHTFGTSFKEQGCHFCYYTY